MHNSEQEVVVIVNTQTQENIMFTPESIIDSVNSAQKTFVETFVKNEPFKKELVKLIDAQTKFAKTQYTTSIELTQAFWKHASDAVYAKKAA